MGKGLGIFIFLFLQLCGFSKLKHSSFIGSGVISEPDEIAAPAASEAEAGDAKMLVWGRIGSVPKPPGEKLVERTGQWGWLKARLTPPASSSGPPK